MMHFREQRPLSKTRSNQEGEAIVVICVTSTGITGEQADMEPTQTTVTHSSRNDVSDSRQGASEVAQ